MKTIFYKMKVKRLLSELEKDLKIIEKNYNTIKFSSQSEKSDVWLIIEKYLFAIEQLKSIL